MGGVPRLPGFVALVLLLPQLSFALLLIGGGAEQWQAMARAGAIGWATLMLAFYAGGWAGIAASAPAAQRRGALGWLWWAALVLALAAVVATALHLGPAGAIQAKVAAASPTPLALFWSGLKGGLLTFGGAYTAIPFIRNDTVGRGWMTDAQFLDGLGLSGILPAPLVIFATFVGFISGGLWGALAVTAGMFLPAFAFSLLFYERLEAVVDDSRLQHVLAGVAAGVVGLIVVTLISLARSAAEASNNIWISLGIAAASLLLLYHWKHRLVPLAVVGLGASAGLLLLR